VGPIDQETEAACRRRGIVARFEDLLEAEPIPSITEIAASLGVSRRMLSECCKKSLGMSPSRYRRLRRMQLMHRALRDENPDLVSISAVAHRYGFRDLGRFAANYRTLYGELPSATLQRNRDVAERTPGSATRESFVIALTRCNEQAARRRGQGRVTGRALPACGLYRH